jgi:hypothetical protein
MAFLDAFLAPFPVSVFLSTHWERAPLHLRRDRSTNEGLFGLADADAVLANAGRAWAGSIRVVQDGAASPLARRRTSTMSWPHAAGGGDDLGRRGDGSTGLRTTGTISLAVASTP